MTHAPTGLDALLAQAQTAAPMDRIELRDPIAAYGELAIDAMTDWLGDPRLAAFAIRVLERRARRGPGLRFAPRTSPPAEASRCWLRGLPPDAARRASARNSRERTVEPLGSLPVPLAQSADYGGFVAKDMATYQISTRMAATPANAPTTRGSRTAVGSRADRPGRARNRPPSRRSLGRRATRRSAPGARCTSPTRTR